MTSTAAMAARASSGWRSVWPVDNRRRRRKPRGMGSVLGLHVGVEVLDVSVEIASQHLAETGNEILNGFVPLGRHGLARVKAAGRDEGAEPGRGEHQRGVGHFVRGFLELVVGKVNV